MTYLIKVLDIGHLVCNALNDSQVASKDMHTAVMCISAMQQHDRLVVKSWH